MELLTYRCKKCNWMGSYQELEFDSTETCMGDDKIEMCPNCGSYEIGTVPQSKALNSN